MPSNNSKYSEEMRTQTAEPLPKNFLFVNTPRGANGSAVMFSLIETAKENGLNPYKYLAYVFREAPNMDLDDPQQLESLLPWNAPNECKIPNAET